MDETHEGIRDNNIETVQCGTARNNTHRHTAIYNHAIIIQNQMHTEPNAWSWLGRSKNNQHPWSGDPSIGCRNIDSKPTTGDQVGCGRNYGCPLGTQQLKSN